MENEGLPVLQVGEDFVVSLHVCSKQVSQLGLKMQSINFYTFWKVQQLLVVYEIEIIP